MQVKFKNKVVGCIVLLLGLFALPLRADDAIWLDIDTRSSVARVMKGGSTLVARYDNIALGKRGAAPLHMKGDDSTPLGRYKVISINRHSVYGQFFGLDYPTIEHAQRAIEQHRINKAQYLAILNAHFQNRTPPFNTPLGGAIGIHGVGKGSLRVHRQFNWTRGCVALDNEQIADLAKWMKIGTRVVIH